MKINLTKCALHFFAIASTTIVFPTPGGPYNKIPFLFLFLIIFLKKEK